MKTYEQIERETLRGYSATARRFIRAKGFRMCCVLATRQVTSSFHAVDAVCCDCLRVTPLPSVPEHARPYSVGRSRP